MCTHLPPFPAGSLVAIGTQDHSRTRPSLGPEESTRAQSIATNRAVTRDENLDHCRRHAARKPLKGVAQFREARRAFLRCTDRCTDQGGTHHHPRNNASEHLGTFQHAQRLRPSGGTKRPVSSHGDRRPCELRGCPGAANPRGPERPLVRFRGLV